MANGEHIATLFGRKVDFEAGAPLGDSATHAPRIAITYERAFETFADATSTSTASSATACSSASPRQRHNATWRGFARRTRREHMTALVEHAAGTAQ